VNQYETTLFLGVVILFFLLHGLHEFMAFRVNKLLPPNHRFAHFPFGPSPWSKLEAEYETLYPRSILHQLTLRCAVAMLILALAMVALRSWEYLSGR